MEIPWHDKIHPTIHFTAICNDEHGWLEPLRMMYDHELVIVKKGSYLIEIEGARYYLNKGDFLIIPPNSWHKCFNIGESEGIRLCVLFDWTCDRGSWDYEVHCWHPNKPNKKHIQEAPDFIPKEIFNGRIKDLKNAEELFLRIEKRYSATAHERALARTVLLELFFEIFEVEETYGPNKADYSLNLPTKTRKKLLPLAKVPVEDMPAIEELLSEEGYSYSYVCRCFKKQYGVSPHKYVTSLRIEHAKLLLKDSTMKITEIGKRVGYNDSSYFSRVFRQYSNISPEKYRKKYDVV